MQSSAAAVLPCTGIEEDPEFSSFACHTLQGSTLSVENTWEGRNCNGSSSAAKIVAPAPTEGGPNRMPLQQDNSDAEYKSTALQAAFAGQLGIRLREIPASMSPAPLSSSPKVPDAAELIAEVEFGSLKNLSTAGEKCAESGVIIDAALEAGEARCSGNASSETTNRVASTEKPEATQQAYATTSNRWAGNIPGLQEHLPRGLSEKQLGCQSRGLLSAPRFQQRFEIRSLQEEESRGRRAGTTSRFPPAASSAYAALPYYLENTTTPWEDTIDDSYNSDDAGAFLTRLRWRVSSVLYGLRQHWYQVAQRREDAYLYRQHMSNRCLVAPSMSPDRQQREERPQPSMTYGRSRPSDRESTSHPQLALAYPLVPPGEQQVIPNSTSTRSHNCEQLRGPVYPQERLLGYICDGDRPALRRILFRAAAVVLASLVVAIVILLCAILHQLYKIKQMMEPRLESLDVNGNIPTPVITAPALPKVNETKELPFQFLQR